MSRQLMYNSRLARVVLSVEGEIFDRYMEIQRRKNSNASAGIRELIKNVVMQHNSNENQNQQLTIPNF
jgi:hypothetical protein